MDEDKVEEGAYDEGKDRLSKLEEEVDNLKKMIEDTLTDIRILINELENPFEYLSKFVDKLPEEGEERGEKDVKEVEERGEKPGYPDVSEDRESYKEELEVKKGELGKGEKPVETREPEKEQSVLNRSLRRRESLVYERALLVGDFLLKTFGKDSVHKMLHLFYRRGLITTDIYMTMLDVIENLNLEVDFSYLEKPITPEDYILALYLLNRVEDIDENEIFLILLMALKRTYRPQPGIQDLLPKIFKDMGKGGESDKHNI